jgi:hypothetical protein
MLRNREEQKKEGRPMPQANEEFGYEDHYPYPWGEARKAPARAAGTRRRIAWEIGMAGCYATTGERADMPRRGGWITGRGDESMKLLEDHARMRAFFEAASWWKAEPRPDLVSKGALCLARPGDLYILYLSSGGEATLARARGRTSPTPRGRNGGRRRRTGRTGRSCSRPGEGTASEHLELRPAQSVAESPLQLSFPGCRDGPDQIFQA